MSKWRPAPVFLLIALNAMLLFFVILEDRLAIPRWLQVAGRLHPMILHFPIVLVVAYAILLWFKPIPFAGEVLMLSAFAAVITALAGVFLATESTHEGSAIQWHKWLGTLTSVSLLTLYLLKDSSLITRSRQKWLAALPLVAVFIAGHYGGDLTHGANYVLAPLRPATPAAPPLDEANAYHDVVYPILDSRCIGCHNSADSKGGLNMEDPLQFARGGRDGRPWDTTADGFGLLMTRLHLPADDKKHMPPINTTQLSQQQLDILSAWVRDGSPFDKKVLDLPATDTLRLIASRLLRSGEDEDFDFPAADEKTIAALNTNYRTVIPLASGSPALAVDFYGASVFQPKQLQELSRIKDQIVWLNLDKMPVADNDLSSITTFRNLRRLNLDFTSITGSVLAMLSRLSHLQSLSLSGDKIKSGDLDQLTRIRTLHELYIWQTGLPQDAVARLRQKRKDLDVDRKS